VFERTLGRWLVAGVVLALLSGCSGVGTGGSTGGYVSGDRTITVVPVADRKPAPELVGTDLDGVRLASSRLRSTNRVLVVNVWGSWCAPCRREAPVLSAVSKQYATRGVAFVGLLSRDKPAAASAFVRRFDLNYPSLQDPGGRLQLRFADTLPSQGIPTTWVIDRHGRVAARVLVEVTKPTLVGLIDDELARK
jgi:thiol-disulfide isomerase/thioredoxin